MLPGSHNAIEVADNVKAAMGEIAKNFPEGISYEIPFDMTTYISESIHHVYQAFFEALLLVIVVVFLSLQNWRATLIPVIAVPISLVGTFGVMLIFGFSLNMLTLLGLILAIGIVVDDAIVVVENVDRIMNTEGLPPQQATRKAMSGLSGALIAMSLVALRRIRPRKLPSGHHGTALPPVHHHHRRISLSISTVVALSLSPVMCAKLLRPASGNKKPRIFRRINLWLNRGNKIYGKAIAAALSRPKRMYVAFGLVIVFIWFMNRVTPQSFMSQEDQGTSQSSLNYPKALPSNARARSPNAPWPICSPTPMSNMC